MVTRCHATVIIASFFNRSVRNTTIARSQEPVSSKKDLLSFIHGMFATATALVDAFLRHFPKSNDIEITDLNYSSTCTWKEDFLIGIVL